jgi:hypothetical protein
MFLRKWRWSDEAITAIPDEHFWDSSSFGKPNWIQKLLESFSIFRERGIILPRAGNSVLLLCYDHLYCKDWFQ